MIIFDLCPLIRPNMKRIQSLSTGHAEVQISGFYFEVNRNYVFSMIEGKLQGYQINSYKYTSLNCLKYKLPHSFSLNK